MKRKINGSVTGAIILFLTSGMLASVLGLRQFERASSVTGWVLNQNLAAGQLLSADVLRQDRIPKDIANASLQNPRQLVGQQLKSDKSAGSVITAPDLIPPAKLTLSNAIPAGRVLYTMPHHDGLPVAQLNSGDRFDVVVTGRTIRTVARDVQLIAVLKPSVKPSEDGIMSQINTDKGAPLAGTSLVMAVRPADVYPLASIGAKDKVSLILHSAQDIAKGRKHSIDPPSHYREIEVLAGVHRHKVVVQQ